MRKFIYLTFIGLAAQMLAGCSTSYTMTTTTGEMIKTQNKPEADPSTGLTKYADIYGYHRQIKTSEITQIIEGEKTISW
ncbi:YgdI/YgdR family lipoprotein [Lelliottia sp.]|uniref:YgdI/YgdR family lipoprotein n=1 Tax=Lelliottia sp. TaxID=1898429 RepID=UPI0038906CD2